MLKSHAAPDAPLGGTVAETPELATGICDGRIPAADWLTPPPIGAPIGCCDGRNPFGAERADTGHCGESPLVVTLAQVARALFVYAIAPFTSRPD